MCMIFDFNQNTIKNFNFLKSIDNLVELYACSLEIPDYKNEYLTPLSKSNYLKGKNEIDYFNNELTMIFLLTNSDSEVDGEILLKLISDDKKIVFTTDGFEKNITPVRFQKIIEVLVKWCRNILLVENIEYDFTFKETEFLKPTELILTAGPLVSHYENIFCIDAVKNGWNKEWSKYLDKFESEFSNFVGSKHAIATSSCTGALHLSLLACGIGKGDEVIVPELTWVATASAIKYVGAKPVFADVDIDTWCIDTNNLESLLTENTKAIMPVHLYGNPVNMAELMTFAVNNNLKVIEDAAPAIGATYDNKKVGSFGDFGCFSFQGAKLLVTGEGGMVVTDNDELFNKFKKLWDHGRVPGTFWIDELGYKHKMSNLQAAFGVGQLENIEVLIEAKRRNYNRYKENLAEVSGIKLNTTGENTESIYWMTSILLKQEMGLDRNTFMKDLKSMNIDTRPVFPSISQYPIWGERHDENVNSKIIGENGVNLPSGVNLSTNEIDYISESIISLLRDF